MRRALRSGAFIALLASPGVAEAECLVTSHGQVTCTSDTQTTNTTNLNGMQSPTIDRRQSFNNGAPINALIAPGALVYGYGLRLFEAHMGGALGEPISLDNRGSVSVSRPGNAVQINGNGGPVFYFGPGSITNSNLGNYSALDVANQGGDISLDTGVGAITGPVGITVDTTESGTLSVATGSGRIGGTGGIGINSRTATGALKIQVGIGGVISTAPESSAIDARSVSGDIAITTTGAVTSRHVGSTAIKAMSAGDVRVTANGPVISGPASRTFGPPGIYAASSGAGNVVVGGTGNVLSNGGRGIWAQQDESGTGSILVTGTGDTTGLGAICPATATQWKDGQTGCSGIRGDIRNPADASNILIDRSGNATGTSAGINARTQGNGNVTVLSGSNAQINGLYQFGLEAGSRGTGSVTVSTAGAGSTVTSGGSGLLAVNLASAIPASAASTITVTTTGSIQSSGNPLDLPNQQNPYFTIAGISAGYAGGDTVQANPNVTGTVTVTNTALVNARIGDGILAFNAGNGAVSVANDGSVNAPTGIAMAGGPGVKYTLTNTGTITGGPTAIDLTGIGGPATINQQGGAIAGNILLSRNGDTLNITGGTIAGNIVGNSAVSGANAGTVNVDAASFTTGGTVDAASINVNGGALLLDNDVTVFGALTNNALVALNGNFTRTVTGSYVQAANGTLSIAISPSGSAQLAVTRTATLAGTLALQYAPGTYGNRTYPLLTASGGIVGSFATTTEAGSVPTALARGVTYTANAVDLVLTGNPLVAPADASLFSAQDSALALLAQQSISTLLGADASPPCAGPAFAEQATSAAEPPLALPFCRAGGWLQLAYAPMQVDASTTAPGYSANAIHLLAGTDWPLADGRLRVGIAAGYDNGWLNDSAGNQANQQVMRLGAYGSAALGPTILTAALGYGHEWNTTQQDTGVGTTASSRGGNEIMGGMQARLPVALGDYTLTPMGGVRFAVFDETGFDETASVANTAFAVAGAASSFNSIVPYARVKLSRVYLAADAMRITPELQVGCDYQAGTASPSVVLTANDGTRFLGTGVRLDRSSAVIDAGIGVGRGNWTVFANVHASIAGNWASETVQAGLRVAF